MVVAHPSKDIKGSRSAVLKTRRVVLCISGSVAASQCPEIARALMREGAEVHAVMSEMAQRIIHPYLMHWATGNRVVTELTGAIEHVMLAGEFPEKADLVLVAPATANTISKIAVGIDDTPVTTVATTAFGSGLPIVIVPAMHESMYRHPIVTENIRKLQSLGVEFVGPKVEEDKAKIAGVEEIVKTVVHRLTIRRDFKQKVLVTAGPTVEYVDPIRVLTNRSSGKTGAEIVEEAVSRGAEVTLVYGPGTAVPPSGAHIIPVETSQEMYDTVISELKSKNYDVVIAAAAVADWMPKKRSQSKVPTDTKAELTLELKPTPKIVDVIKQVSPDVFLVAFKAESKLSDEKLVKKAYDRLRKANADLIVANDVGRKGVGFAEDTSDVFIIDRNKEVTHVPLTTKREVAKRLIDTITRKRNRKHTNQNKL